MTNFKQVLIAMLLGSSLAAHAADSATGGNSSLSVNDRTFIEKAGHAGAAEVGAAKLALKKSQNAQVKLFATQMVNDHGKANKKLESLAASKHLAPPGEPDAAQKAAYQKLEKLSGSQFDSAYVADQVKAHDEAVELFTHEAADGEDKDLKQFASDTLPTLKEHQSHIKELSAKIH